MTNSGSLDTNALLRLLVGDIPNQAKQVVRLLDNGRTFIVSDTAILEIMFVLERHYKTSRKQIAQTIYHLTQHPKIQMDSLVFGDVLRFFGNSEALSPEDCYLVAKAKADKALPLWTFDKKLIKQSEGLAKEIV